MSLTQGIRLYRHLCRFMNTQLKRGNQVRHVQEPGYDSVAFPGSGYERSHKYTVISREIGTDGSARLICSRRRDGVVIVSYSRAWNTPGIDDPTSYTVFIERGAIRLEVMTRRGEHMTHDRLVPARHLEKLIDRMIESYLSNQTVYLTGLGLKKIPGQSYRRGLRRHELSELDLARMEQVIATALERAVDASARARGTEPTTNLADRTAG